MGLNKLSRKIIENDRDYNLIVTCYHEAGHILVALRSFILPLESHVMRSGKLHAETTLNYFKVSKSSDGRLHNKLCMSRLHTYAAGIVAEEVCYRFLTGQPLPKNLQDGWASDSQYIDDLLAMLCDDARARARMKIKIFKQTNNLIEKDWHIVIALAHELYKKKYLSYEDICAVVIRSDRPFAKYWRQYLKECRKALESKKIPGLLTFP